ncbi:carbon storage regulator CsrA [Virgibacillus dakarensis]|uniref:Translational regulator CsrA n=1 Tax=Lentibacillus populi TaxID=1827502 RepID=A0A9W5U0G6_9BACI|nr:MULTISPECIES: carbon storage regulator CsrA [Bacillaceae]MBT2216103.1 carbon storage regulator CsrA [Virgibacillus dakarensis]MTW86381.1 carbon storage regulator CsrA [Virgibacillus dakarensis]GGB55342.1 carbon storage regulator [Lentibacillus populi]
MLVLTRKKNEAIQIGESIEVKVLEIDGDQVKLGIHAPKSVDIHRSEIYLDIQRQNNEAASTPTDLLQLLNNEKNT